MAGTEKTTLALRLRLLRIASGMKQEEVADMLGIGRSAYTYYELSRSKPDYDALIRLAKLYRVSIDYLVGVSNFPDTANRAQLADTIPAELLVPEASFGRLTREERYLLGVYRQLSEDGQMDMLDDLNKRRAKEQAQ